MELKINGLEWKVVFTDKDDENLTVDDIQCLGVTHYIPLTIYLNKDLPKCQMKQTVIHELTHAYIFSYGVWLSQDSPDKLEECVCDFVGAYLRRIRNDYKKVMKAFKFEN